MVQSFARDENISELWGVLGDFEFNFTQVQQGQAKITERSGLVRHMSTVLDQ